MPVDNSGALQPKHKSGLAVSLCPDVTKEVLKKGGSRLRVQFHCATPINWLLFWARKVITERHQVSAIIFVRTRWRRMSLVIV